MRHQYFVYILTNSQKTVLYTGVTNDLAQRITEHYLKRGNPDSFAGRYHCYYLVYYEPPQYIRNAIAREKEIKSWYRSKKEALISAFNPEWKFLNSEIMDWPPQEGQSRDNG
jgi:putative endonuclease